MKSVFTLLHTADIHYVAYFICLIFLIEFPSSCVTAVVGGNTVLKANSKQTNFTATTDLDLCTRQRKKKKDDTGNLHYTLKNKNAKIKKNLEIY